MAVQAPALSPAIGHGRPRAVVITGKITIGAAGAVASFECEQCSSTGIVKTGSETGRYTVTLLKKYRNLRPIGAPALQGPADAALTSTDGWFLSYRNITGQTFDIQASQVSLADANPTNGNVIFFAVEAQR
jgi:hypothetical protein